MQLEVGEIYEGKVTGITKFGAFVTFEGGQTGMVHISEVAPTFVNEIKDFITEGQTVKVRVLAINEEGKVSLSIKKALPEEQQRRPRRQEGGPRRDGGPRREGNGPRQSRGSRPAPQPGPGRPGDFEWQSRRNDSGSFEDMMSRFKQTSDEKMSDLKRNGMDTRRGGYSRRGQQK